MYIWTTGPNENFLKSDIHPPVHISEFEFRFPVSILSFDVEFSISSFDFEF